MSGYQLNKSGASALGYRPRAYDFEPFNGVCNDLDTQPRSLQTAVNVSIFLSMLLIHSAPTF